MAQTHSNHRPTLILALGLVAVGALMLASPAEAQERFRVLVPKSLARQGDVKKNFGEDVTKELKELIGSLPTHTPVEKGDLKDALKQYKLDEDDLSNCITARQLAAQRGFELVLCGSYAAAANGFQVEAEFISPRENQIFKVPAFAAVDKKQAAQHIFESFKDYVNLISYSKYCMDHLGSQQWQEALERCDAALAIDENAETALYGRGYALMQLDQNEPAMAALTRILEQNPIHQDALKAAGFLAAKMGLLEDSRKYYGQYLELNPNDAGVRLTIATDAAKAGDPEGALQVAEAGLQGDSIDLVLVEYAGYFAMSAASKIEESTAEGENGGEVSAAALGMYEKAIGYFDRVLAVKADSMQANLPVSYVNALNKLGRTGEAVERATQFLQLQADNVSLWNVYASALRDAGRIDEALAALDSVVARDPQAQMVRARQAQWLLQAGNMDRAKVAFRQAVDNGELQADQAARAFLAVGYNDKFPKRDYDGALPYFSAALEFAVDAQTQGMAHYGTGYVLFNRGLQMQAPSTAASANKALPVFRQAFEHFEKSRPYAAGNASLKLDELLANTQQYIEIQEALIKRGR